jgi:hypothetical protein
MICLTLILVFLVKPEVENQYTISNENRTLLVQFRGPEQFADLNFVVTQRGTKWIYIPNSLVFSTSPAIVTMGSSSQNLILQSSLNRLNDAYGLAIDDVWQIDRVAFASFVEAADGVEVKDLEMKTLTGFEAATYVFDATENPKVIYKRFKKVWRQVIDSFGSAELTNVLTSIGSSSRSSIAQAEFAGYLKVINKQRKEVIFRKTRLDERFKLTLKARKRLIDAGVRETLAP